MISYEVYRRLARHSRSTEANNAIACNTVQRNCNDRKSSQKYQGVACLLEKRDDSLEVDDDD